MGIIAFAGGGFWLAGVVLTVAGGLLMLRLAVAYRRTDPAREDPSASMWGALQGGFWPFCF